MRPTPLSMTRCLLIAASLGLSPLSQAGDTPLKSQLGRWIAIQGELALRDIADDARRELDRQLQPLRPDAPDSASNPPPPTAPANR